MSQIRISNRQARRIALAAQGFGAARPEAPSRRHLAQVLDRLHLLQIDSINVLARAHYMPPFTRLGAYDPDHLNEAAYGPPSRRRLFEYWGHEASLLRLDLHPLLRWRMARAAENRGNYGGLARFGRQRKTFIKAIRDEIAQRGKISAGELSRSLQGRAADGGARDKSKGSWWEWNDTKLAMEWLFWAGEITTAERRNFERIYDLTERMIPVDILDMPTPPEADAQRELIRLAMKAHGIASAKCLGDYFRLSPGETKARIAELVEEGELTPVDVEGWSVEGYIDPGSRIPRRIGAQALLSPFDPLVWERKRTESLYNFRYRIEIYTPAHKREFGYYTLPLLVGEQIVARIDLKAERKQGQLVALSIHPEAGIEKEDIAPALGAEFSTMARWQGLKDIVVPPDWRRLLVF